jgi:hypothetical protein
MADAAVLCHFVREPQRPYSGNDVRPHLSELVLRLRQVQAVITVSVAALRHQSCDLDEDIADVLQHNAGDAIDREVERSTELLSKLDPRRAEAAEADAQ